MHAAVSQRAPKSRKFFSCFYPPCGWNVRLDRPASFVVTTKGRAAAALFLAQLSKSMREPHWSCLLIATCPPNS